MDRKPFTPDSIAHKCDRPLHVFAGQLSEDQQDLSELGGVRQQDSHRIERLQLRLKHLPRGAKIRRNPLWDKAQQPSRPSEKGRLRLEFRSFHDGDQRELPANAVP